MATKIMRFEVDLLKPKYVRQREIPMGMTNDKNTIDIEFTVNDLPLQNVQVEVLLYMEDGSFFQNDQDSGVRISGKQVHYVLDENEGRHAGRSKVQLVVMSGVQHYATQIFYFDIINGLEEQVVQEVVIRDWTTITGEARTFIDEMEANEIQRQVEFENLKAQMEAGGGGTGGSGDYVLPQATNTTLGGIRANPKTNAETGEVKIDGQGRLYAPMMDGIDLSQYAKIPYVNQQIASLNMTQYATKIFASNLVDNLDLSIYAKKTEIPTNYLVPNDLNNLASLDYVNQQINGIEIPEIDLSPFATLDYVNTLVDNLELPNVNLDEYATIDYVSQEIANIPETDLTNYATLDYVAQEIAKIEIPDGNGSGEQPNNMLPPIMHLNGPEYGANDYIGATNTFHNENLGVLGSDYTYDTQASLDYLANRGWKYVKLPIRWERIQGTINGDLRSSEVALLTGFMDRAHNAGLKVIIDIHNYGLYYRNVGGVGTRTAIGDSALPISAFADVWRKLAIQYKNHPATFAYALMAEPQGAGGLNGVTWRNASQSAVDAIREIDTETEIHVAGFDWSSMRNWEAYNGSSAWIEDDSGGVIRYEAHHYFDADHSGSYEQSYQQDLIEAQQGYSAQGNKDAMHTKVLTEIRGFNTWLERNNVLGIVGEMGWIADDADWEDLAVRYLDEALNMNIPVVPWCAGEWTEGDNLAIYGVTNYVLSHPFSQALIWEERLNPEFDSSSNYATISYVNQLIANLDLGGGTGGDIELATPENNGLMSATDKQILDDATVDAVADTIVKRDQYGYVHTYRVTSSGEPDAPDVLTRKDYVDQQIVNALGTVEDLLGGI